jgi:hypothetical protein
MITREQLMAFADGEVTADEADEIDRAVSADPALARQLEDILAVTARVRDTMPTPEPIPADEALATLIRGRLSAEPDSSVVELAARRRRVPGWAQAAAWPSAIAATLLVGISLGWSVKPANEGILTVDGAPRAELASALTTTPSGGLTRVTPGSSVRPTLSFATADGRLCRQFALEGRRVMNGVACKEGESWRVVALAASQDSRGGDYTTAAGPASDAVVAVVDGLIAGEPLDQAQEAARIRTGWRTQAPQ